MKFKKYVIKWACIILTFQWEMNVFRFLIKKSGLI